MGGGRVRARTTGGAAIPVPIIIIITIPITVAPTCAARQAAKAAGRRPGAGGTTLAAPNPPAPLRCLQTSTTVPIPHPPPRAMQPLGQPLTPACRHLPPPLPTVPAWPQASWARARPTRLRRHPLTAASSAAAAAAAAPPPSAAASSLSQSAPTRQAAAACRRAYAAAWASRGPSAAFPCPVSRSALPPQLQALSPNTCTSLACPPHTHTHHPRTTYNTHCAHLPTNYA